MALYNTGTVSVTNGNANVDLANASTTGNIEPGFLFVGPDGRTYGVVSIVSTTRFTITPVYAGSAASGGSYFIAPTKAAVASYRSSLDSLVALVNGYVSGVLAGKFSAGSEGAPPVSAAADPDTGIRMPGSNILDLIVAGLRRVRLTTSGLNVSVPITGTAVQQNATDWTAGRLLLVGAGGLGTQTPSVSNCNDAVTTGFWRWQVSSTNSPASGTAGMLITQDWNGDTITQMAQVHFPGANEDELWVRHRRSGVWSAWTRVVTEKTIEFGANANGYYLRLPDGTQECWIDDLSLAYSVGAYCDGLWTFPAAFIDTQYSAHFTPQQGLILTTPAISEFGTRINRTLATTGLRCRQYRSEGRTDFQSGDTIGVHGYAKGRWY